MYDDGKNKEPPQTLLSCTGLYFKALKNKMVSWCASVGPSKRPAHRISHEANAGSSRRVTFRSGVVYKTS